MLPFFPYFLNDSDYIPFRKLHVKPFNKAECHDNFYGESHTLFKSETKILLLSSILLICFA